MMLSKFFAPIMEPAEEDDLLLGLTILASFASLVTAILYKNFAVAMIVTLLSFIVSASTYCLIRKEK